MPPKRKTPATDDGVATGGSEKKAKAAKKGKSAAPDTTTGELATFFLLLKSVLCYTFLECDQAADYPCRRGPNAVYYNSEACG